MLWADLLVKPRCHAVKIRLAELSRLAFSFTLQVPSGNFHSLRFVAILRGRSFADFEFEIRIPFCQSPVPFHIDDVALKLLTAAQHSVDRGVCDFWHASSL